MDVEGGLRVSFARHHLSKLTGRPHLAVLRHNHFGCAHGSEQVFQTLASMNKGHILWHGRHYHSLQLSSDVPLLTFCHTANSTKPSTITSPLKRGMNQLAACESSEWGGKTAIVFCLSTGPFDTGYQHMSVCTVSVQRTTWWSWNTYVAEFNTF